MEEDNTIVITKKNRRLLGFLGVEHEYLVIPPEVLSRGKIRRVEAIGENAFRCGTLERVVLLDGVRTIERQAFLRAPGCWRSCCRVPFSPSVPEPSGTAVD